MVSGRAVSSGIPFWPVDTVLSIQLLTEFVDRLERRCRNAAAEESVYARLLRACGRSGALDQGRRLHRHLQLHADDRSLFFGNRLVNMYSRCQSLEEARLVFDRMRERDVVSWTSIITAYTHNGHSQHALDLYVTMVRDARLEPNRVTFIALLGACDSPEFLDEGQSIHRRVSELGLLESDLVMGNAVMGMYRRCARSDLALRVFADMRERDLIAWNTAIAASAETDDHARALVLLKKMLLEGVIADKVTFVAALNACIGARFLVEGRSIHALVAERALDRDVVLGTALVAMYGRCGCLAAARAAFDRMPQRNAVSWNAMIAASAQVGEITLALALFKRMLDDDGVEPTRVTFIAVLNAITTPETLEEGRKIHAKIAERGLLAKVEVANALVTMYGRCGSVDEAEEVFESIGASRDVISWNAMLSVYAQRGFPRAVVELFHRMRAERVAANRITFLTALDACAESGDLASGRSVHALSIESGFGCCVSVCNAAMHLYASCCWSSAPLIDRAGEIFAAMRERDVISWNTMITGNVQAGRPLAALLVFKAMLQEGIHGNDITFMSILSVCDSRDLLREGRIAHRCLAESEFAADPIAAAAAVSMYGKCGDLATARSLFDAMAGEKRAALPAWNAMISAYALHGCARAALDLAERMRREGVAPDRVTFITLLNACVIAGSIREGRLAHSRAIDAGLDADPVVTNAIVNMYSKCGDLELAASLFRAMDRKDVVSWNGMIAGLAHNGLARDAMKHLWKMQQDGVRPDAITFMITLSACSHAGFLRQAGEDFVAMAVDHELERGIEHYGCMVDLLGRAGMIGDAEAFVGAMPGENKEVWLMTLLAACEVHGDEERAKRAAGSIVDANPRHSSAYVALSNLYASGSDGAMGASSMFRRPRIKKPRVLGGAAD